VKWADAYDLQKRTGYVFCPRDVVPIVALAASPNNSRGGVKRLAGAT
jgi:hypothetical protein